MSAPDNRCTSVIVSPFSTTGEPESHGGQCCGGKGPAVISVNGRARCTLCFIVDHAARVTVTEDAALLAEAREWDPDADFFIEQAKGAASCL